MCLIFKNQPVYYVPYVRFKDHHESYTNKKFQIGDEYPIYLNNIPGICRPDQEVAISNHVRDAYTIHRVPFEVVELITKVVVPKFKLNQIIRNKNITRPDRVDDFRVYEYNLTVNGDIWYSNPWSLLTGYANGLSERDAELAPPYLRNATIAENEKVLDRNDHEMREKFPDLFRRVTGIND